MLYLEVQVIGLDSVTLLKTGFGVDIGIKKAGRSSRIGIGRIIRNRNVVGEKPHLHPSLSSN